MKLARENFTSPSTVPLSFFGRTAKAIPEQVRAHSSVNARSSPASYADIVTTGEFEEFWRDWSDMQLAASHLRTKLMTLMALRSYFTELCASIGASMIHDHDKVSINVDSDSSSVGADASMSLGLIVTELVINALKHAFPGGRHGKIMVGYHAAGADWTLSVRDDGIGMSQEPKGAKAGLGTSIVEALANQLGGKVVVTSNSEGTEVAIVKSSAATTEPPQAA